MEIEESTISDGSHRVGYALVGDVLGDGQKFAICVGTRSHDGGLCRIVKFVTHAIDQDGAPALRR